jgi:adenylate cyclase class 2
MKPHHEIEIKLEVRHPRLLKKRLAALGFRAVKARHLERNYMFDFPDRRLRKARRLLRLRFAGPQPLLTYKGSPLHSQQYKIRSEIETHVEDGHRLRRILECLGLKETFRFEKYRTVYAQPTTAGDGSHRLVVYDETPVGDYLELEGSERWIDEVAQKLGYQREDYITASYAALFFRKCSKLARVPGNMVFD